MNRRRSLTTGVAALRKGVLLAVALGAASMVGVLSILFPGFAHWLLDLNYDLLVGHGARATKFDPRLELVLVDDASVNALKEYPLRRTTHARLCRALSACGVSVIAWDFLLDVPDEDSAEFATAMEALPSIIAAAAPRLPAGAGGTPELSSDEAEFLSRFSVGSGAVPGGAEIAQHHLNAVPLSGFMKSAARAGHVNRSVDTDGLLRHTQLAVPVNNQMVPSLPLAVAMLMLGIPREELRIEPGRELILGETMLPVPIRIPIDAEGYSLGPVVREMAGAIDFRSYSATLSTAEEFPEDLAPVLRGKTVVVGTACTGSGDFVATPGARDVPGCVLVLCTINAILGQQFIRPMGDAAGWMLTFAFPVALALAAMRRQYWTLPSASLVLVALLLGGTVLMFQRQIFMPVGLPLVATLLAAVALLAANHVQDFRYSTRLAKALARFVSPALLQQIQHNQADAPGDEPRRAEVSVLFLDVAGFTRFCEEQEPESISELLGRFYRMTIECVVEHGGTVDKVLGDGVLAYFDGTSAPADKERAAVEVARATLERFASLRSELTNRGFPDLQLRGAVTTSYVMVGTFGDETHATYTIVGRAVNLASRLQSLASPGEVVVDRSTAMRVKDHFSLVKLDPSALKGIDRKIEVWQVTGPAGAASPLVQIEKEAGGATSWSQEA